MIIYMNKFILGSLSSDLNYSSNPRSFGDRDRGGDRDRDRERDRDRDRGRGGYRDSRSPRDVDFANFGSFGGRSRRNQENGRDYRYPNSERDRPISGNDRWQEPSRNDRWQDNRNDRMGGGGRWDERGGRGGRGEVDWTIPTARDERLELELFGSGNTGINFSKYEDIPVEATGENIPSHITSVSINDMMNILISISESILKYSHSSVC